MVLSHARALLTTDDGLTAVAADLRDPAAVLATWHNHSPADVMSFFAGLELGPGVTEAQTWRAWMPEPLLRRRDGHVLAGVARRHL
jgi:hypothetical protein